MLKGNKGEWSELYVLLKLLADGKLYAADENLERIEEVFYPIIKILRNEVGQKREYALNGQVKIIDGDTQKLLTEFPTANFIKNAHQLFQDITKAKGRSFSFPQYEDFLTSIDINSLKAKSIDKSDITLIVHDLETGQNPQLGFSIKSLIGKNSTLFNPQAGTNFIYKIGVPEGKEFDIEAFNQQTFAAAQAPKIAKIAVRLERLADLNYPVIFDSIQSQNLELNLTMVDSKLPSILSYILYYKFRYSISNVIDLITKLNEENPLDYNMSLGHPFYEFKIKNLLSDYALGMTPESVWTGQYDATGGIIIVKSDGDVLCYHICDKNKFQDYLINHTKLEQASTSENKENPGHPSTSKSAKPFKFGWVSEENGEYFIKLNLQIRFK